ncbi:hypothetical protein IDG98_00575 [Pelagibacterales bacterium SAG-MED17]|nr:hypothetical protein [Pelagibacterales bacterium SAG-MED17]
MLEDKNSWHDEWHSIYVSDPNIDNSETLKRFWGDKGDHFLTEFYPPLYLFLLKFFFKIFGYVDDYGRFFSLIFGVLVVPCSMYLAKFFTNSKKNIFLIGIFLSTNLFLIWQSLEIRAHLLVVFINLINIILFLEMIKSKTLIKSSVYFLVSLFNISLWPISGLIFVGKSFYLLKEVLEKKQNYSIFVLFFLILVAYIFLNFDYLKFNLARDFHYTSFSKTFFYNFHFRSFFGSIFVGGIFLLSFAYLVIKNYKIIIFQNLKEDILFYIISSTYLLTIIYSLIRAPIMSPKYVIFVIPLILIWTVLKVSKLKNSNFFLIILFSVSCLNLYNINDFPIKRPETKVALKKIVDSNDSKYIFTKENDVFKNYLKTKKIYQQNNLELIKYEELSMIKTFWYFCLNNPRFAYGDAKLKTHQKCKLFDNKSNFLLLSEFKFPDIIIKKYIFTD